MQLLIRFFLTWKTKSSVSMPMILYKKYSFPFKFSELFLFKSLISFVYQMMIFNFPPNKSGRKKSYFYVNIIYKANFNGLYITVHKSMWIVRIKSRISGRTVINFTCFAIKLTSSEKYYSEIMQSFVSIFKLCAVFVLI